MCTSKYICEWGITAHGSTTNKQSRFWLGAMQVQMRCQPHSSYYGQWQCEEADEAAMPAVETRKGVGKTNSSIDTLGSMYSYSLQGGEEEGDRRWRRRIRAVSRKWDSPPFASSALRQLPLLNPDSELAVVLPRSSGPH